jgi:hypothetical protein
MFTECEKSAGCQLQKKRWVYTVFQRLCILEEHEEKADAG